MVTFLVLNTAGVTLLPTTVMSIRQALGSEHPLDFVFIGIFATICASFTGIMLDRFYRKKKRIKVIYYRGGKVYSALFFCGKVQKLHFRLK